MGIEKTVEINRVTAESLPSLLPLMADYQRFYRREPDAARNEAFFTELLDGEEGLQLLATQDGKAVGFATLYWVRQSTVAQKNALLNDLYAVPETRGSGVGYALLKAAAEHAAAAGFPALTWTTAPDNVVAQKLYDRFLAEAGQVEGVSVWKHYGYRLTR
ncbi:GNAT family N-acetyltransferase [Pseudonocardiaceae bacterium YIM PH 21723]|nr:GNAT family N-acetyltransferase [Pseudonocardiaceae bacterium YIM PH 21723]